MEENNKFKKILRYLIIFENIFIAFVIIFILSKNFKNYNEKLSSYLINLDVFISKNINYFFISLLFLSLVILTSILIWKKIFTIFNYKKSFIEVFHIYIKIFFKRLFSPLGPISPILNISEDLKTSTLIFSTFVFFITLGSITFFSILFILSWPILILAIPLFVYLVYKSFKKLNLKILKRDFFVILVLSYLNEFFSYSCFLYSIKFFDLKINPIDSLYIYFVWVISSSLFPFLYGSGASEILSVILASNFGYDEALFSLGIIYYRFIITYLPLILLIFDKKIFDFLKNYKNKNFISYV
jgi:hypothetical protein